MSKPKAAPNQFGESKLIFTPGSKDVCDPEFMRANTDDATVKAWIAELNEHHARHTQAFDAWETGFIKKMAEYETYTGHQIVMVRRYFGRLVRESAKSLASSQIG